MNFWLLDTYNLIFTQCAERCYHYHFVYTHPKRSKRKNFIVHVNKQMLPMMRHFDLCKFSPYHSTHKLIDAVEYFSFVAPVVIRAL